MREQHTEQKKNVAGVYAGFLLLCMCVSCVFVAHTCERTFNLYACAVTKADDDDDGDDCDGDSDHDV